MLKRILSISGRPGLFKLISSGKNMLVVEDITTGKRTPAYTHDKVVSLGDISIYTEDEDIPLSDVLDKIKTHFNGKPADIKSLNDEQIRELFAQILPNFDKERVYTSDIRKVFTWYNKLIEADIVDFKDNEIKEDEAAEAAEKADEENKA